MMTRRFTLLLAGLLSAAMAAGCTSPEHQLVSDEAMSGWERYPPSPPPAEGHGGDGHSD